MKLDNYDVYRFGPKRLRWEHMFRDAAITAGTLAAGIVTEEIIRRRAKRRTEVDFVIEKMRGPLQDSEGKKGDRHDAIGRKVLAAALIEPPQKSFGAIVGVLRLESAEQMNNAIIALKSLVKNGMIQVDLDSNNDQTVYAVSDPLAGYLSEHTESGPKLRAAALQFDPDFSMDNHRDRLNARHSNGLGSIFIGRADNGEV